MSSVDHGQARSASAQLITFFTPDEEGVQNGTIFVRPETESVAVRDEDADTPAEH